METTIAKLNEELGSSNWEVLMPWDESKPDADEWEEKTRPEAFMTAREVAGYWSSRWNQEVR